MSQNLKPSEVLFDFVIDQAKHLPAHKRIEVYEACAALLKDQEKLSKSLRSLAAQLEAVERETMQLHLQFRKQTLGR